MYTTVTALMCFFTACNSSHMKVDGDFSDWGNTTSRVLVDGTKIWIDIRTPGPPVNLQQLQKPMSIELQLDDGTQSTIELTFSPSPRGMGVGLALIHADGFREARSPYELDLIFAPTTAANRFELVMDLASLVNAPAHGRLQGLNGVDSVLFTLEQVDHHTPTATIPESAHNTMRIVSWNVQFGTLLKQPAVAARVLQAISPDVLLLQELEDDQSPQSLCAFLNATLGTEPHPWRAVASPTGSRLRSMIAARSLKMPSPMPPVTRIDGEMVRVALMPIIWKQQTWLMGSLHLRCCGGIGGPQDLERIMESHAINDAIDNLIETIQPSGIILGGDLNLVGSDAPLKLLTTGRDLKKTNLQIAEAMQLDQRSWTTWSDTDSAFTPGRLDWIIYSSSTLQQSGSFVFDTLDLSPTSLERHRLHATDTAEISDHLPLVLDAQLR
jgi:endonuclease/exonuclease/phosphatase family metal-dependent hydrolase